jgi:hypothetical protein
MHDVTGTISSARRWAGDADALDLRQTRGGTGTGQRANGATGCWESRADLEEAVLGDVHHFRQLGRDLAQLGADDVVLYNLRDT